MREPVETRLNIPPPVQDFLRRTIASAGGNEVFFLARVLWTRQGGARVATLDEVEAAARGNAASVPAIVGRAEAWDLAIHNHPGGDLEPSDADVAIAAELAARNVGFAIISNDASRTYLVAGPFERPATQFVAEEEVREIFAPGGSVDRAMEGFEARAGQLEMALEVARALNGDRVVAVEAGTGVGKSFAYLVPAILWAVRNSERVVVATGTINLQEQLFGKDLPFLSSALPVRFQYALAKGRANYACLRKADELEEQLRGRFPLAEEGGREGLEDLIAWARTTKDGSRSDLAWSPPDDVWELLMCETDKCLKLECRHYDDCFFYRAKRSAASAQIVVANHHLFFADLAVRRETENFSYDAVLPACRRVIFDEAHHLEDVAAQYLGVDIRRGGLLLRLAKLVSPDDPRRGAIPALGARLRTLGDATAAEAIEAAYVACVPEVSARVEAEFARVEKALSDLELPDGREPAGESRESAERQIRYRPDPALEPFWSLVSEALGKIAGELAVVLRANDRAVDALKRSGVDPERRSGMLLELTAAGSRLEAAIAEIELFRDYGDASQVRWLSLRPSARPRARAILEAGSAPIRVGGFLKDSVYDAQKTVVLTSATLAVAGSVEFLADRLGLSLIEGGRFAFEEYPSPFDFERQVLAVIPTDVPPPDSREFAGKVPEAVFRLLEASGGRAFVLFTSYRLLRSTYDALEGRLAEIGLRAGCQGQVGRSELLNRFRAGAINVLFGTDSFWEGVDVKGRPLECVIITRLPFRVPSDPIQEARLEDIESSGANAFAAFTVPQAVLRFKQGFGRLIRSKTDRGVVAILDSRILSKPYGRTFLKSLPKTRLSRGPLEAVAREVAAFFPDDTLLGRAKRLGAF
ncbi:MAG: helicase C-terminal domain-containing protein [Planctomycetota bacterium]